MIYNSTNFIFYDNNNDSYDKPWQNLLHKISSAYMTKPFGVVKIESGECKCNTHYRHRVKVWTKELQKCGHSEYQTCCLQKDLKSYLIYISSSSLQHCIIQISLISPFIPVFSLCHCFRNGIFMTFGWIIFKERHDYYFFNYHVKYL